MPAHRYQHAGALLTSKAGLTFEANYGRQLIDLGLVGLTAEVPFVVNFSEDVHFNVNLVPKNYKSFFVTPSLRANIFPGSGLSPWVSAGGGFGYFKANSTLEFGGPNPAIPGKRPAFFRSVLDWTSNYSATSACAEKSGTSSPACLS